MFFMNAKVVIVEDDPLVITHVSDGVMAEPRLSLLGTAGTLREARALLDHEVDLFILDLGLPDGNGVELIKEIRVRHGMAPKILVLSVLGDQETVLAAVFAGADGYLLKDQSHLDIGQQVANALTGAAPLSPSIATYVLRHLREQQRSHTPENEPNGPELSPREFELLQLLARGHSVKQAASVLCLSPYTVGDHVKSIYRKLGVSSRGEAIMRSVRSGLLRS
jgi:DNA-binding NarL/FixJ family response regulator